MEISNGVNHSKTELHFLLILLLGIFVLAFFIFKPFLYALILATVFATVFGPVHTRALGITRGRSALGASHHTVRSCRRGRPAHLFRRTDISGIDTTVLFSRQQRRHDRPFSRRERHSAKHHRIFLHADGIFC